MESSTKASGSTDSNTAQACGRAPRETVTSASGSSERRMDMEFTCGSTATGTRAISDRV